MAIRPIRVVLVGFGKANQAVLELVLLHPWLQVVGVVVRSAARRRAGPRRPRPTRGSNDLAGSLHVTRPDLAIVATAIHLADVLPVLNTIAVTATPIVCTAEDLAHTRPSDSPEAARIIELAEAN